ncbi:uncharacterized protein UHOR_13322 [Ustilago hordei]|uniref:Uncharacterized protein n=1 Tax=Ustilago hordei TaxID=120017 RepID=I2FNY4_USTHO|nr:uncharacterized protein UHOR_13322 [Ustilago hordei]
MRGECITHSPTNNVHAVQPLNRVFKVVSRDLLGDNAWLHLGKSYRVDLTQSTSVSLWCAITYTWQSSINHHPRQHQMTWPKAFSSSPSVSSSSSTPPVAEGLWLEHMFIDATSKDGQYAESTYSGFPVNGGSRQASDAEGLASRPSFSSKFGSLGRIKGRRPRILANPAFAQVLGTSSLGRATSMRRTRQNAVEVWSMG